MDWLIRRLNKYKSDKLYKITKYYIYIMLYNCYINIRPDWLIGKPNCVTMTDVIMVEREVTLTPDDFKIWHFISSCTRPRATENSDSKLQEADAKTGTHWIRILQLVTKLYNTPWSWPCHVTDIIISVWMNQNFAAGD